MVWIAEVLELAVELGRRPFRPLSDETERPRDERPNSAGGGPDVRKKSASSAVPVRL